MGLPVKPDYRWRFNYGIAEAILDLKSAQRAMANLCNSTMKYTDDELTAMDAKLLAIETLLGQLRQQAFPTPPLDEVINKVIEDQDDALRES